MSKFIIRRDSEPIPDSPEALFGTLRTSGGVHFLWAHQADMLRLYHEQALEKANVALELPTGFGKTLVGLLIADWRRRSRHERAAYVCPTTHLANQVGIRAREYGLTAVVLTGPSREWDSAAYMAYERTNAVGVSTYSAIFNTHPRLDDVQTLVLDDAHAGEGPVAGMWSLTATRGDGELYAALASAVIDELPAAFAERVASRDADYGDRGYIELVAPHQLASHAARLREAIDAHAEGDAAFAGSVIGSAIDRCVMYISWQELLIRPLIAPTVTHRPFAQARQRIYMSATLGAGGELERAFGVPNIDRLPAPKGWQEHGSGRRFFLFPGAALDDVDTDALIRTAAERAGRSLVLAPSRRELERAREAIVPVGVQTLGAADLERDPAFATAPDHAMVLLANRYDGIDLPDEACRLIVLTGLPSGTHLQERFIYERLGARRVLSERIQNPPRPGIRQMHPQRAGLLRCACAGGRPR